MDATRVVDNTLPQSAADYVLRREAATDPLAEQCFGEFVNVFVNSVRLHIPVPAGVEGGRDDAFLLNLARKIGTVATGSGENWSTYVSDDALREMFFRSVAANASRWSGWLRFQASPSVQAQYRVRVVRWQQELETAWSDLRYFAVQGRTHDGSDGRLVGFIDQVGREIPTQGPYARELEAEAIRLGVSLAECLVAYAWNWFLRGRSYASRFDAAPLGFHALRDAAVRAPAGTEELERIAEIDWYPILYAYLERDATLRHPVRFCEALETLRHVVLTDDVFHDKLAAAAQVEDVREANRLEDDAIERVLTAARLPLQFRADTKRAWFRDHLTDELRRVERGEGEGEGKGPIRSMRITARWARYALESETLRVWDVRVRRYLGLPIWHIYERPRSA